MGNEVDALYAKHGESSPLDVRLMHKALTEFRRRYGATPANEGCEGVQSSIAVGFAQQGERYWVAVEIQSHLCGTSAIFERLPTWEFDAKGRQVKP